MVGFQTQTICTQQIAACVDQATDELLRVCQRQSRRREGVFTLIFQRREGGGLWGPNCTCAYSYTTCVCVCVCVCVYSLCVQERGRERERGAGAGLVGVAATSRTFNVTSSSRGCQRKVAEG